MPTHHVVDTHALIWFFAADARLGSAARDVLSDPRASLVLPAICPAEICWMVERNRVGIGPVEVILNRINADSRIVVDPLDRDLVERTARLGWRGEMHDRQIVCTALRLAESGDTVHVLTADAEIRASGLVPIVW
jgi:PIN domain nuclease of toxin-antitoxin system